MEMKVQVNPETEQKQNYALESWIRNFYNFQCPVHEPRMDISTQTLWIQNRSHISLSLRVQIKHFILKHIQFCSSSKIPQK